MSHPPRTYRSAFTLLELLLATSVLALMTVLLSAMGVQLRAWSEDGERLQDSMRLQRVVEVMRDQWAGRVGVSTTVEGLQTTPEYLSFVTSRPVLDPAFPVVRATYRWVERENDSGEPLFDLIYEETPVGKIGRSRKPQASDTDQAKPSEPKSKAQKELESQRRKVEMLAKINEPAQTWPLLSSFSEGGWERYGLGAIVLRNEAAELKEEAPIPEFTLASPEQIREERLPRWREYDQKIPGAPKAVRLAGTQGKEQFTCVFVIAASP